MFVCIVCRKNDGEKGYAVSDFGRWHSLGRKTAVNRPFLSLLQEFGP